MGETCYLHFSLGNKTSLKCETCSGVKNLMPCNFFTRDSATYSEPSGKCSQSNQIIADLKVCPWHLQMVNEQPGTKGQHVCNLRSSWTPAMHKLKSKFEKPVTECTDTRRPFGSINTWLFPCLYFTIAGCPLTTPAASLSMDDYCYTTPKIVKRQDKPSTYLPSLRRRLTGTKELPDVEYVTHVPQP